MQNEHAICGALLNRARWSTLQDSGNLAPFSYDERRWFAGHVDRNSSAHVAHVVGLQTDAVVVTETRFNFQSFALWIVIA